MMLLQNTDMSDAGISKVFNNFMNHVVVPDNQLNISKAIVAREEQKWKKYIEDTYINPTKPDHDKNIKKPEDKSTQLTDEQMGLGKQKFL
jgi:hypothetical protein